MAAQIAAIDERDVEGYLDFLEYAARLHRITGPVFVYNQPPTPRTFLGVSPADMVRVDPWLTMDQAIRRRVHSPQMRQLLGRFATYVGASPFQAPATLSVIAHVELTGGVWYPRGGIYQIAAALARLATELGVTIHTQTPVARIVVTGGRATGVVTADGRTLAADAVIANVDVTTVYEHLLPPNLAPARRETLRRRETSCSGYALLLGVAGEHPQLAHHNIFSTATIAASSETSSSAAFHPTTRPSMSPLPASATRNTRRRAVKIGSCWSMRRRWAPPSIGRRKATPTARWCWRRWRATGWTFATVSAARSR
jgi:diapolycopene oxygenase